MPQSAITPQDFRDREFELERLVRFSRAAGPDFSPSVLLLGPRGMGKSELLKQLYHRLFWEESGAVPFYYRFRRATLKARHFSNDYLARFLRQFVAYLAKDPALADNMSLPLARLALRAPHELYAGISELLDDFQGQAGPGDLPGQLFAAISAPLALAGSTGRRVVIMLDDFHLAAGVYESEPGDTPGVVGMFEQSMAARCCPHVVTGSPEEALEKIFSDDSLRGKAERLRLGPLPADAAYRLFTDTCHKHGASVSDGCAALMKHLGGNPLYIRQLAGAMGRAGVAEVTSDTFMEQYSREVCDGEIAAYWSSVIGRDLDDPRQRALAAEIAFRLMESPNFAPDPAAFSRRFGVPEKSAAAIAESVVSSGMLPAPDSARRDTVMEDCVRAARMLASGADGPRSVREHIARRRFGAEAAAPISFEMVIPGAAEAELVAAKAVEQICAGVELDELEVQRLVLALIEACINAMEHGDDGRVFLRCSVYPGRLELSVESGGSVDPESLMAGSKEMPGIASRRGRGLSLMGGMVDDIRVERTNGGTRVVLVKNIRGVKENR